jgi:hypothetical protein
LKSDQVARFDALLHEIHPDAPRVDADRISQLARWLLGKLDDVVLLELAWPALAAEVDEYDDFCRYRNSEHPFGSGMTQRASWVRDRLAAMALVRHQMLVSESHYAESGRPATPFRVGG